MTTTLERISDLEREKTLLDEVKAARIERLMSELTDVTYKDFGRDAPRRSAIREEITEADLDRIVKLRVAEAVKRQRERSMKYTEKVKRLYFNAGRYAGGARDVNAQTAHAFVMSEGGD
jgi:hypothetical protein